MSVAYNDAMAKNGEAGKTDGSLRQRIRSAPKAVARKYRAARDSRAPVGLFSRLHRFNRIVSLGTLGRSAACSGSIELDTRIR
jgi:hypothetical protein